MSYADHEADILVHFDQIWPANEQISRHYGFAIGQAKLIMRPRFQTLNNIVMVVA